MRPLVRAQLLLVTISALSIQAAAADRQPYELVRELQVFQDQAVLTGNNAPAEQRDRIAKVATQLSNYGTAAWTDPRNARGAVIYVLSGGDPRVLRKLTEPDVKLGIDQQLVKAALAYGERRDEEATKLFEDIDVDMLDRSIGGHVALVRALLVAKDEQKKAFALLSRARILAPGTLVEEAALRRQSILAAKIGEPDAFEALSSQYLRRFASSIFARSFESQFAGEVVARGYSADAKRMSKLEILLRGMPDTERGDICLALAEEGIAVANVDIVRFAARLAAINARGRPLDATRMMLFEAAALIVTDQHENGLMALRLVDKSKLGVREEALLHAALSVAEEISRPPSLGGVPGPEAPAAGDSSTSSVISNAEQALARADGLLSEAPR